MKGLEIPPHVVSDDALHILCAHGVSGLQPAHLKTKTEMKAFVKCEAATGPGPAKAQPATIQNPPPVAALPSGPAATNPEPPCPDFSEDELTLICDRIKRLDVFPQFEEWVRTECGADPDYEFGLPDNDRPLEIDDFVSFMKSQGVSWNPRDVLEPAAAPKQCSTQRPDHDQQANGKKAEPETVAEPPKKRMKSDGADNQIGGSAPLLPDMADMAMALVEARPDKKRDKKEEQRAKAILKTAGFDFNRDWQGKHKGNQVPKGHWKHFLECVLGKDDVDCVACQQLLVMFDIDRFRTQTGEDTPRSKKRILSKSNGPEISGDGTTVYQSPPKKRARAGRPRKEEAQHFDLLEYLKTSRAGQYRFLDREEAIKRLGRLKRKSDFTDKEVAMEMQKRPAQCQVCGGFVHFQYLSNTLGAVTRICLGPFRSRRGMLWYVCL